jgi:hypothetical protein
MDNNNIINDESSSTSSISSSSSNSLLFDDMINKDVTEIGDEAFISIEEYLSENILEISNPLFHINMSNIITDHIYETVQYPYDIEDYDVRHNQ